MHECWHLSTSVRATESCHRFTCHVHSCTVYRAANVHLLLDVVELLPPTRSTFSTKVLHIPCILITSRSRVVQQCSSKPSTRKPPDHMSKPSSCAHGGNDRVRKTI
mmetsp:Transcript_15248/g.21602  ORF Transcript_15248/g.21602 Transcript_15248/m.21602 type:complete len:106 (+) Transcript_15248:304-621(+)